ncbi:MAG: biotin--[acetyl-CoA-carboxylase] ligase [Chloroflexi bacterium RBG_13_46_9]|nr:MAG: biotin--[acetyl-CoA-carboxylase] ligase [Chloroflexi bacterium RBG_13_46_9]
MHDDSLTRKRISRGLKTRCIGKRLLVFPVLTSTMDIARQEAVKRAPEGTAVIAERQTAGRGRLKRTWLTTEGNIAVSIIIYPPKEYIQSLIMLASLAVLNSIRTLTGIECQLKWPNDVLVGGKKVCGILIETKTQIDCLEYAILGIGINVNMKMAGYPELFSLATSLSEETDKPMSRARLLRLLFTELERLYLGMLSGKSLYDDWSRNLSTVGKAVRVQSGETVLEGTAESVKEDGSLILRLEDNSVKRITIGDVSLREEKEGG